MKIRNQREESRKTGKGKKKEGGGAEEEGRKGARLQWWMW